MITFMPGRAGECQGAEAEAGGCRKAALGKEEEEACVAAEALRSFLCVPKGTPTGTRLPALVVALLFHDSAEHSPFNTHGLRMLKWQLYNRWM